MAVGPTVYEFTLTFSAPNVTSRGAVVSSPEYSAITITGRILPSVAVTVGVVPPVIFLAYHISIMALEEPPTPEVGSLIAFT